MEVEDVAGGAMETKSQLTKIFLSPVLILAVIAGSIYVIEFIVMVILIYLPHESQLVHALLDSTILILMLSPVLYFFLFKPLLSYVTERKKMAEEILQARKLESLGVLAGGIAHDYNNLLTAIMANISFVIQMGDSGDRVYKDTPEGVVLECLMDAEKATLRAKDLTKQLLTFSKGGAPVKETVVDIDELIKESISFALSGSNVRCDISAPDNLFPVEVDAGQISQVLQNIIINADQAMPIGGLITVKVENLQLDEKGQFPLKPGNYLEITIRDQGMGMPEEDLSKIFDPYFTTKKAGSGLGLATAYSIIKKHGGHISVESEIGVGTTFKIYLKAFEKKLVKRKPLMEEGRVAIPKEGEGRILVMDDEELIRKTTCRILSEVGYEVESVKNGNGAIDLYLEAKLSARPFDLVIMDLTIPGGLGGKEAIKELFKLAPEAKVIVSSGYSDDPIMEDFKKYGFKGAVVKPYNITELRRVIHEVLTAGEEQGVKSPSFYQKFSILKTSRK
jgi:signal transduction histidine kinase/FixJ family two-component response regulator